MKIKYILALLLAGKLSCQKISGRIMTEKQKPIADARIGIENENIGDLTDQDGKYTIDVTNVGKDKILKVLVNGYEPFRTKVEDFSTLSNHDILLSNKFIEIPDVEVIPKKYVTKNFGTKNSKKAYCGYNSDHVTRVFQEYAIKVRNNKRLKIKNINLGVSFFNFEKPVTLIFDVQNSVDDFPGTSLVNETLKFTFSKEDIKNNMISFDVSDKRIWLDSDFFVTVRTSEDFQGKLYFGGNVFAFSKSTYHRSYFGEWKKFSVGEPSINVDVLVEK